MTDTDRGAYTPPTEAPLSFDARKPIRGSRPLPLTLIVSGLVLVLLIAAIIVFYRSGVRQAGEAPATVGDPVGPMVAAAPKDAQPTDPAAGLQIYKDDGAGQSAPTFTPPPEAPQARPEPPPTPVPAAKTVPAPTPAPAPAPAPAAVSAGLKPAQPPAAAPVRVETPRPALPKPAPVAVKPPAPVPAPTPKTPPAPTVGGASVQIGAFSSQALADKGYADAGRITGVDIAGKSKRVEKVDKGGSTLFRTTVVGFVSRADAVSFCNELKAAGKSCFVK